MSNRVAPLAVLFLFAASAITAAYGAQAIPCESSYRQFTAALTAAHLPEDMHRKLAKSVARAWRASSSGVTHSVSIASSSLADAKRDAGPADGAIPAEVRESVWKAVDALVPCTGLSPRPQVTLTVHVTMPAGDSDHATDPAGVGIRVDGVEVAKTGADGTATLKLPQGDHLIAAEQPPDLRGVAAATDLYETPDGPVEIALSRGADLSADAELDFAELRDGVLPRTLATATLQLQDDSGNAIRIKRADTIELESPSGVLNVTSMFKVRPDGSMQATAPQVFRAVASAHFDPLQLTVHAFDTNGKPYRATLQFAVGRYRTAVRVTPPAAGVSVASIPVRITNERSSLSFWSVTSADGVADFPLVPDGHYELAADSVQGATRYFVRGGFDVNGDGATATRALFSVVTPSPASVAAAARAYARVQSTSAGGNGGNGDDGQPREHEWGHRDSQGRWRRAGEVPETYRGIAITFNLTPEGTLQPALYQSFESENAFQSKSEAELEEAVEKDKADPSADVRHVNVRVYDERGNVIYRTTESIVLVGSIEGVRVVAQRPYLIVQVPAGSASRIETDAFDARLRASFDLAPLTTDARLRTGEFLSNR